LGFSLSDARGASFFFSSDDDELLLPELLDFLLFFDCLWTSAVTALTGGADCLGFDDCELLSEDELPLLL